MREVEERSRNRLQVILISLLVCVALLMLFTFRALDDNRLVSWSWIFLGFPPIKFAFVLAIGIILAYVLSLLALPEKITVNLLFLSSFFISVLFWGVPEVIIDSARYFTQAKFLELYGVTYFLSEWGNDIQAWTDLPLVPFIYGVIFRVFGENRIAIQIFNTLLFSGTIVLTYLIGKTLWSKNIGLYAGVLLLGMPYLAVQVPLTMADIAAMFSLTLAVFATIKAVENGKNSLCITSSVVIVLAMLTKYSNWVMLSIIPIIFLSYYRLGWKKIIRRGTVITLFSILPLIILLAAKPNLIVDQLHLLRNFQAPALYRWQESWISTFFFQIHPVITLSALFSVYVAIVNKDTKYLIVSWLVFLVILLDIQRIRYVIAALPMVAIMASYGISALGSKETRKFIVSITATSALLLTLSAYIPFLEKNSAANIKQAGIYLNSINAGSAEVIVLTQNRSTINPAISLPLLDLFTEKDIVYSDLNDVESPRSITRLPWRWTWAVTFPHYRTNPASETSNEIVVVIQSGRVQQAPPHIEQMLENYHLLQEFTSSSGAFRYKTLVYVYQRI